MVIAACLLMAVVALRWFNNDASDSEEIAFQFRHAKATPEVQFDEPIEPVEPVATQSDQPYPQTSYEGIAQIPSSESESIEELKAELPAAKHPAEPLTNELPVTKFAGFSEVAKPTTESNVVNIPTVVTTTEDSIELADNLESVVESVSEAAIEPVVEPAVELIAEPVAESVEPFATPSPTVAESLPDLEQDPPLERIAALPQAKDKPRFKKFAATSKDKESDQDDEEDEDDDPPSNQPGVLSGSKRWKLAGEPKLGDRYKDDTPLTDSNALFIEGAHGNFSPTPTMPGLSYDPYAEMNVYQGKQLNANQRPLLELGRPWYQLGPISEGSSILGFHNNVNPQYLLFGDSRIGFASNRANGDTNSLIAAQLNLIHHFKFTSTERFVAGMSPLSNSRSTNFNFDNDETTFEGDADFDFAYFEGDIGALTGGFIGKTLPFDLPIAAGIVPLVFQNGIWLEDEILGVAVTIPARNSARFDISNMDITFFAGYDRIDSPAFQGDDSAARVVGVASFIDALNGFFEIDYAFLDDRTNLDRSYHNIGLAYTRRYGRFISNSTRVIINAGQQSNVPGTADGVLLLSENSLITRYPSTVVPYFNFFAGFDQPQSVGRNNAAGGILRNTGILFESDNLTGYPTLDATANDTFGAALGLNLLADDFAQQFIVEAAALGVIGDDADRNARGDQYGVGVRYQLPLTNSVIFRADAMVGFLRGDEDINGGRLEIRKKF